MEEAESEKIQPPKEDSIQIESHKDTSSPSVSADNQSFSREPEKPSPEPSNTLETHQSIKESDTTPLTPNEPQKPKTESEIFDSMIEPPLSSSKSTDPTDSFFGKTDFDLYEELSAPSIKAPEKETTNKMFDFTDDEDDFLPKPKKSASTMPGILDTIASPSNKKKG